MTNPIGRIGFPLVILALIWAAGCAGRQVSRLDPNSTTDLSGRWNDTDSRLVAEEMVRDCLSRPWLEEWSSAHDAKPVVIVGKVVNRSHEHIQVDAFINDIQQALINSGKVRFVASSRERDELRGEKEDQQQGYTRDETQASVVSEEGANFMLKGEILTTLDEAGEKAIIHYQVTLDLYNISTNELVWKGKKEIKKKIERNGIRS